MFILYVASAVKIAPTMFTKSGIMVGLGETDRQCFGLWMI